MVDLQYREFGTGVDGEPVVLLHGLFGSAANWQTIARRLEGRRRVLVPDLRNHGRSPHRATMSYSAMAADLTALLERLGVSSANLVGHSLGGKVAMWLALREPRWVARLVAVDIAPVRYPNRFVPILQALGRLPLDTLAQRRDADAWLATEIPAPAVRAYLLQNLERGSDGRWRWRLNLRALTANIEELMDFPAPPSRAQFLGETLFVYGGNSDYVGPDELPGIRRWFPYARLRAIPGAGHWVYADQPDAFLAALDAVLPEGPR